jgi:hypothetical protein
MQDKVERLRDGERLSCECLRHNTKAIRHGSRSSRGSEWNIAIPLHFPTSEKGHRKMDGSRRRNQYVHAMMPDDLLKGGKLVGHFPRKRPQKEEKGGPECGTALC